MTCIFAHQQVRMIVYDINTSGLIIIFGHHGCTCVSLDEIIFYTPHYVNHFNIIIIFCMTLLTTK